MTAVGASSSSCGRLGEGLAVPWSHPHGLFRGKPEAGDLEQELPLSAESCHLDFSFDS